MVYGLNGNVLSIGDVDGLECKEMLVARVANDNSIPMDNATYNNDLIMAKS